MSTRRKSEGETDQTRSRRRRSRPTPGWLHKRTDLDEVARRRCLLVLSVLSGERPVTEVIEEQQVTRTTYYQWEDKALKAMLLALVPGAESSAATGEAARMAELEARAHKLEQRSRRLEHLLELTRKVMRSGPVLTMAGQASPARRRVSTKRGPESSSSSGPSMRAPGNGSTGEASMPGATTGDGQ